MRRGTGAVIVVTAVLVIYILLWLLQQGITFITNQAYNVGELFIK
jgi:hypothetical protein